jgi:hypothetical protein
MQAGEAQLFYVFSVERHVPADHLLRRVDAVLDLYQLPPARYLPDAPCRAQAIFATAAPREELKTSLRAYKRRRTAL